MGAKKGFYRTSSRVLGEDLFSSKPDMDASAKAQ